MKDKAIGFYFSIAAAILSAAGLILYSGVMYKLSIVYVFCAIPVVLFVIVLVCSLTGKNHLVFEYLPVANAACMACAAVWAVYLMVNQIGYVVAALDDKSTIMGLIYFEVAAVLAMIINIVAAFMGQSRKKDI